MESQASLQHFSSALSHIEQGSLRGIASGEIRVDLQSCKERIAVRCLTCLHQVWVKSKKGQLKLNFRKSDRRIMGYVVSAEIPKAKQCKQFVCLSCIQDLLGMIAESDDGLSVTLSARRDGKQDSPILQREGQGSPWKQSLQLTNELLGFLREENARTMPGQRPKAATAASQIGNRGMAKGVRPRVKGVPEETSTQVSSQTLFS
jgi:hypothetical protein